MTKVSGQRGPAGIKAAYSGPAQQAGKAVAASLCRPYVLRYFGEADILIAADDSTYQSQVAVIKWLTGEMDFRVRLPVKLVERDGGD